MAREPTRARKAAKKPAGRGRTKAPKTAAAKSKATKADGGKAQAESIRIRMYRQGLGDCLLLGIPGEDRTFWMLVDCGLILGTTDAARKIEEIVADVAKVTGGHLDVLAVTHQHWDHISGFALAREAFEALRIDAVWMAWTEDPKDELATRLRRERDEKLQKLAAFVGGLGARGGSTADRISAVLNFFNLGFGAAGPSTADALAAVRGFAGGKEPIYWRPGDAPLVPPQAPAVRIYALGPPQSEKALKKTFAKSEVYHVDTIDTPLFGAVLGAFDTASVADAFCPFDRGVGTMLAPLLEPAAAGADPDVLREFLDRHYLDADRSLGKEAGWRRIDDAWLGAAAEFALALDSATNNTSLVLAIEIVDTGAVILLAADAQVGNWLSWHEQTWEVGGRKVTAADLLGRTVFYKVGHHGSHNATLQKKGLEMMLSPDLVAFIPVDRAMARQKGWNEMPLPGLVNALQAKTKNRLLQADQPFAAAANAESGAFAAALEQTSLYFEHRVPLRRSSG